MEDHGGKHWIDKANAHPVQKNGQKENKEGKSIFCFDRHAAKLPKERFIAPFTS